jgi:predicted Zn-dependent protease
MAFRPARDSARRRPLLFAPGFLLCGLSLAAAAATVDGPFETLLDKGFALHQQARFAQAIPVLERARMLQPDNYFVNLLLGIDLLRVGKAAAAIPRLKLAARVKPSEEFPEDYLGEAEATLGQQALAAEAFQQAVARGHDSEQSLEAWAGFALERFRAIGEQLRASGDGLAAAVRLLKDAEAPATADCEASIPALERRLALRFATDTAYRLSICYAQEAGAAAERLQTDAPEDVAAMHRLRGDVLLRLKGDGQQAMAEYRSALAAHPGDPELLERLAEAQMSAGDAEGARLSAQTALAVDGHRPAALHTLAELAMSDRDYERALPWLRQLVAQSLQDRADQVQLGRALAQTGQPEEAVKWLAPALAAGYPDEKGALHALLAGALRRLGRDREADAASAEARRLSDAFAAASSHPEGSGVH